MPKVPVLSFTAPVTEHRYDRNSPATYRAAVPADRSPGPALTEALIPLLAAAGYVAVPQWRGLKVSRTADSPGADLVVSGSYSSERYSVGLTGFKGAVEVGQSYLRSRNRRYPLDLRIDKTDAEWRFSFSVNLKGVLAALEDQIEGAEYRDRRDKAYAAEALREKDALLLRADRIALFKTRFPDIRDIELKADSDSTSDGTGEVFFTLSMRLPDLTLRRIVAFTEVFPDSTALNVSYNTVTFTLSAEALDGALDLLASRSAEAAEADADAAHDEDARRDEAPL